MEISHEFARKRTFMRKFSHSPMFAAQKAFRFDSEPDKNLDSSGIPKSGKDLLAYYRKRSRRKDVKAYQMDSAKLIALCIQKSIRKHFSVLKDLRKERHDMKKYEHVFWKAKAMLKKRNNSSKNGLALVKTLESVIRKQCKSGFDCLKWCSECTGIDHSNNTSVYKQIDLSLLKKDPSHGSLDSTPSYAPQRKKSNLSYSYYRKPPLASNSFKNRLNRVVEGIFQRNHRVHSNQSELFIRNYND